MSGEQKADRGERAELERMKPGAIHHTSDWLRVGDRVKTRQGHEGVVTACGTKTVRVKMETGPWAGDEDPFLWTDLTLSERPDPVGGTGE